MLEFEGRRGIKKGSYRGRKAAKGERLLGVVDSVEDESCRSKRIKLGKAGKNIVSTVKENEQRPR